MRRPGLPLGLTSAILVAALQATGAYAEEAPRGAVRGRVAAQGQATSARAPAPASPLARVTVYAYELAQHQVHKVISGAQGEFSFEQLPAGVYKLIAFKAGYEPAVVMLSRVAAGALQVVELKLAAEKPNDPRRAEGFWAVRDQIPPDVLRDIESVRLAELAQLPSATGPRGFSTAVRAMTGVEDLGDGRAAQLAGGGIGMEGRIGALQLDVTGEYWRLLGSDAAVDLAQAQAEATALAVRMAGTGEGRIDVTTVSHRLPFEIAGAAEIDSADFERYRVSWSQPFGERSRSRFAAQYTSQNNFFRPPSEVDLPHQTRALNLEGAYLVDFTERSSLEAGVRYRQQEAAISSVLGTPEYALELFGKGGWRLQPSVLVEYGMFTQLRDGSWALAPQGGVVVQLGQQWQAVANASHRVEQGDALRPFDGVTPVRFSSAGDGCRDLEQSCYRVMFAHQGDRDQLFAVGIIHRELAEALHLYFDDNFLHQLESVYLVEGDELPELQVVVERRLTPRVLARLESSYAEGGGGILYAVGDTPHENRVRYLVTSVDTHFQQSSTGVFLAFHSVEQGAAPAGGGDAAPTVAVSDLERLQLMLSQDLNVLARLAADWAVQVNFELSRGSLPFTFGDEPTDDLRRRVTGGLSVRF